MQHQEKGRRTFGQCDFPSASDSGQQRSLVFELSRVRCKGARVADRESTPGKRDRENGIERVQ